MKDKFKKRKSICFFINSDWYFKLHWIDRAKACLDSGYEVHILCHFTFPSNKKFFQKEGFYCHESNLSERSLNPFGFILSTIEILKLIKYINPNILHAVTIKPILISGFNSLILHKTFISSFVGLGRVFSNRSILYLFIRLISGLFYKVIFRNNKNIAIFEHETDFNLIQKVVGKNKINGFIIDGSGVALDKFNYTNEPTVKKPCVLFASRLLWSKGLGKLIEVKKKLAREGIDFELKVAGIVIEDDRDAISLCKINEWKEKGFISWLGTVNDISKLIDDCHIIALPSTYSEGIPRILIEGAAKGRPCIAYDCGGCYKIIINEVNGYLITKGDDSILEEKIKTLILNKDLRISMGVAGRDIFEKNFSSNLVINKTLNVYKNLIE